MVESGRAASALERAQPGVRSSGRVWLPIIAAVLASLAAAILAGPLTWLPWMGEFLVSEDQPAPADIIVVLGGGTSGDRIMKSVELVSQGYAPKVLVSGPHGIYDASEPELAIPFAVRRGAPREIFEPLASSIQSTHSEVQVIDQELLGRGFKKAIIVTTHFHTRRTRFLFGKDSSGQVEYHFVASDHPAFRLDSWWTTRLGKKTVLLEYLKIVYSCFE